MKRDRDVEKHCALPEFVAELRRLADTLEAGAPIEIEIDGELVQVPTEALASIEHEREGDNEEIEFQLTWNSGDAEDEEEVETESDADTERNLAPDAS
ncbi:MAG: amphi-Trp domain-containing protein [Hyphomicrobiaceae bacterium]